MYIPTPTFVSGFRGLAACSTAAATALSFPDILATIKCELERRFNRPDDPALLTRRARLRALFNAVPPANAIALYEELSRGQTPLSKLFHGKLATATRRELVATLGRRFFKDYELGFNPQNETHSIDTNPNMTDAEKTLRKSDVNSLIGDLARAPGLLWRRLLTRADAALEGRIPTAAEMPAIPASLRPQIRRLSDAQLELFRDWFPDGTGGIDFRPFQRVFEQFANGELRDPSITGHPSFGEPLAGNYFLFAEFAFLCVDAGFAVPQWTTALRTFVKTQEVFMHVYREKAPSVPPPVNAPVPAPGPEKRDIALVDASGGFHFSHFRQTGAAVSVGKGQSNTARKQALRSKYDGMDISALKAAARDNLLRATRMP
jgi:hypothetical protein